MAAAAAVADRRAAFQELLGLAGHSFGAYVVESSSPVVVDDTDRKLLKLFQDLLQKERHYVERAYELLDKSGFRPDSPPFPLRDSNFNFLRPVKLADHWPAQVAREIERLEALKSRVTAADPCGRDFDRLVDDLLALRREGVAAVARLRAESSLKADQGQVPRPAEPSKAPPGG